MIKKTITFKDLDDNDITEDFYFNLTESELVEMELSAGRKGFSDYLTAIVKTNDMSKIFGEFKNIILNSYGERSDDGRRFIKSPELSLAFTQTDAYNILFMELVEDEGALANFVNSLVPAALAERAARMTPAQQEGVKAVQAATESSTSVPIETVDETPWITEDREPTKNELRNMTREQMEAVMAKRFTKE